MELYIIPENVAFWSPCYIKLMTKRIEKGDMKNMIENLPETKCWLAAPRVWPGRFYGCVGVI